MSNVQFKGSAQFTWTDGTTKNYLLSRPLDRLRYAVRQTHYTLDSLDFSVRQTYTLGSGVYEVLGDIRYDADSTGLSNLLRAGARGLTLTYWPKKTGSTNHYDCYLIQPTDPGLQTELEESYPARRNRVTLRLRKTNGAAFPSTFLA